MTPGAQAIIGLLIGTSLVLVGPDLALPKSRAVFPFRFSALFLLLFLFTLVPWPARFLGLIDPGRLELASRFPLGPAGLAGPLTISLSPANSLQRLWELALIVSAFFLARAGTARAAAFPSLLALFLATALLALAASDIWLRATAGKTILGIWPVNTDHAAATFANRNHFANWACVAALFLVGAGMRIFRPGRADSGWAGQNQRFVGVLCFGAAAAGFLAALITRSRGALLALVPAILWLAWSAARQRQRRFSSALLAAVGLTGVALAVASSQLFFPRFQTAWDDFHFKAAIWRDTLSVWLHFPVFGTGLGSFLPAFSAFKTFAGTKTFWHAENDYLQWLLETGLAGAGLVAIRVASLAPGFPLLLQEMRRRERHLFLYTGGALLFFATHALLEFPFQILANALLISSLAGMLCGFAAASPEPSVLPNSTFRGGEVISAIGVRPSPGAGTWPGRVVSPKFQPCANGPIAALGDGRTPRLWAIAVLMVALAQGAATLIWRSAASEPNISGRLALLDRSIALWPLESSRQIARARARLRLVAGRPELEQKLVAARVEKELNGALKLDPLNWELRLERAWLYLAYHDDLAEARAEAWRVVRLNRLQPRLPLGFAAYFAKIDPPSALQFLAAVDGSTPEALSEALRLTWEITHDTTRLWAITPATPEGLRVLGAFAQEARLFPMSVIIFQRLQKELDRGTLAEKFLAAERADLAIDQLKGPNLTPREKWILSRAWFQSGDYLAARQQCEELWNASPRKWEVVAPKRGGEENRSDSRAVAAAEAAADPARPGQWDLLLRLSNQAPRDLHLRWLLIQAALRLDREKFAAEQAIILAGQIVPP